MKRLAVIITLCLCLSLEAQQVTVVGPATANPGQVVAFQVIVSGFSNVAGLQYVQPSSPGIAPDPTPTIPKKVTVCITSQCMISGNVPPTPNNLPIPDGAIFTAKLTVPAVATGTIIRIGVDPLVAVDPNGFQVALNYAPYTLTVVADPLDLNTDGRVDMTDYSLASDAWSRSHTQADASVLVAIIVRLSHP